MKYVRELEDKEFITTKTTTYESESGQIRNGSLEYKILPIQKAVDYYNETQRLKSRW